MNQFELGRIRQAQLSPYDVKVLTTMMETGGEFPFYVDRLKPEARDHHLAGMNSLIARDLIEVDPSRSQGHRWILRLTSNGRAVCEQLETMNAKSPVEVHVPVEAAELVKTS